MKKWIWVLRVLFTIAAIGINFYIIYQSCLNSSASSTVSSNVTDIAGEVVNTVVPGTLPSPASSDPNFSMFVRKFIGHFGLCAVSGLLTYLALYFDFKYTILSKLKFIVPITLGFGIFLAALTENIQIFVDGRCGLFTDSLIDFAGYFLGCGITFLITLLVERKLKKQNKKSC